MSDGERTAVSVRDDSGSEDHRVPGDAPERCPVCETAYESVSVHEQGVAVNLLDNERYRRVCFEPVDGEDGPLLRFYHHTHEQAGTSRPGSAGGRVP